MVCVLGAPLRPCSLATPNVMQPDAPEITRVNAADHHQPRPQHDILEVNEYLTSGLVVSQIDKWFIGPAPRFTPESLGVPQNTNISLALRKARAALNLWDQTVHDVSSPRSPLARGGGVGRQAKG